MSWDGGLRYQVQTPDADCEVCTLDRETDARRVRWMKKKYALPTKGCESGYAKHQRQIGQGTTLTVQAVQGLQGVHPQEKHHLPRSGR
jgi:hypothetical protein